MSVAITVHFWMLPVYHVQSTSPGLQDPPEPFSRTPVQHSHGWWWAQLVQWPATAAEPSLALSLIQKWQLARVLSKLAGETDQ